MNLLVNTHLFCPNFLFILPGANGRNSGSHAVSGSIPLFLFGVIFTKSDSLRTIPYGLYSLRSEVGVDWAVLMAGLTLTSIPLIALFLFMQKQFVRGLTAGSVKG